jgi:hypothetical protein
MRGIEVPSDKESGCDHCCRVRVHKGLVWLLGRRGRFALLGSYCLARCATAIRATRSAPARNEAPPRCGVLLRCGALQMCRRSFHLVHGANHPSAAACTAYCFSRPPRPRSHTHPPALCIPPDRPLAVISIPPGRVPHGPCQVGIVCLSSMHWYIQMP